jgi:dihydroorotate dehydrogenase
VSSPNTPGLRDLQRPDRLVPLLEAVADASLSAPLMVKLSPDLAPDDRDRLVEAIARSRASGLILANTTTSRDGLASPRADEGGGVSGRPLLAGMLASIARSRHLAGDRLAVIASGGIASGADAMAARAAGADLVQLWTGMIYAGPGLIGETVRA